MSTAEVAPGIPAFRNRLPVDIRFGEGVVAELASVVASEQAHRPFVILDAVAGDLPGVADALASLGRERVEVTTYVKAPGEPTDREADSVSDALSAAGADIVVAIGGGSVIDLAKAARLALSVRLPYLAVAADLELAASAPAIPLVAVPRPPGRGRRPPEASSLPMRKRTPRRGSPPRSSGRSTRSSTRRSHTPRRRR